MTQKPPSILSHGLIYQTLIGQSGQFNHCFGGENDLQIIDFPAGQQPLHRVISLDLTDPRLNISIQGVTQLPLLYGLVYDGCEMTYEVLSNNSIRMIELSPSTSSDGWPYPDYPLFFQSVNLEIGLSNAANEESIDELTWWLFDETKPSDIWVNVPSNDDFGVSLWGSEGDSMGVELVFRIDPETRIVTVKNECG